MPVRPVEIRLTHSRGRRRAPLLRDHFLSTRRHPPRTTLFPYTTLFRSITASPNSVKQRLTFKAHRWSSRSHVKPPQQANRLLAMLLPVATLRPTRSPGPHPEDHLQQELALALRQPMRRREPLSSTRLRP